jgi:hypothetical protein
MKLYVNRFDICEFITRLRKTFGKPGRLFFIGETSQVLEGWREKTGFIEFCAEVSPLDRPDFTRVVKTVQNELEVRILEENPAEIIPLPDGYEKRAREIAEEQLFPGEKNHPSLHAAGTLQMYHFDPYSVAIRYIARGDEPDYHLVLNYITHGWISKETMDQLLAALLPRFSLETIQQDPAEFRRKYKGLTQMYLAAIRPGEIHRHTPA